MALRVTQGMLTSNFLYNLNTNLKQFQKYQEHLETTRRINRPSDDPVGFLYSMRYRTELRHLKQYRDNVNYAQSWMDQTETLINSVNDIVKRAYELAVNAANDTNDGQPREAMADEIDQLFDELVGIANTKFQGRYVFGGDDTSNVPYDPSDPANSKPDNGKLELEIGPGIKIQINMTGEEVFGSGSTNNSIFNILFSFSNALRGNDQNELQNAISKLQSHLDHLSKATATIGARYRRVEMAGERLQNNDVNLQGFLSLTEDADIAETITKLKMVENVYNSSLAVGARIMQPSLIDFLK